MPSETDPTRSTRRRLFAVRAGGLAALAACTAWAWWPVPLGEVDRPSVGGEEASPGTAPAREVFNVGAFTAALWVEPPTEEAVAQAPPPPPAVRLELIGIVSRPDPATGEPVLYAALHDPDQNRLHLVRSGDRLAGETIESVESGAVVLSINGRNARLALAREAAP